MTSDQDVLPGIGQDSRRASKSDRNSEVRRISRPLIKQLNIRNDQDIADGQTDDARLLEKFRNRLDISRRGLTYVIGIRFMSNRPQQAAYYANAIAEAFVASQGRAAPMRPTRPPTGSAAGSNVERTVEDVRGRRRYLQARAQDRQRGQGFDHPTIAGHRNVAAGRRCARPDRRGEGALRAGTARLKANVEGPIKQDLLSALRAHRSALNDQIAQKRAVFGDRHPDLVISYSQLNDLNRQIEVERTKSIDTAKSEYEAQLEQQKSLENQLKTVESQMLADGQALVRLQELQRDAEANRNIYEQFLSRFKATNEQRLLQNSQTKIASPAIPPLRPTLPPLSLLLAALAIASLLISTAVVAVMRSVSDKSRAVVSPVRAPHLPTPPVWARIPDMPPRDFPASVWQRPVSTAAELDLGPHVRPLLEKIGEVPGAHGKVVLVVSVEVVRAPTPSRGRSIVPP